MDTGCPLLLLIILLVWSVITYRPFCKYLCPLGAIYGLLQKFSFFQMEVDQDACIQCGACGKACKMKVDVLKNVNSPECIRCMDCKNACPVHCIKSRMG